MAARKPMLQQPTSPTSSSIVDPQSLAEELFQAVKTGDAATLTRYCATTPKAVDALLHHKDVQGNTAMLYAAANGHTEVAKILLKYGGDVNCKNDYGWTPLKLAVYHNHIALVRHLTSIRAINLESSTSFGFTALIIAIQQCHLPIVRHLVEAGARANSDLSSGPQAGMTPLMMACHVGKGAVVSMLLQRGSETNAQSRLNGWTPLMYAASSTATVHIVKTLVENGADYDVKAWNGQTAIDIAKNRGHGDVVSFLEGMRAASGIGAMALNMPPEQTRHRIFDAISNDDHAMVQSLVMENVKVLKERDPVDGLTPLMLAAIKGDVFVTKLLLAYGDSTSPKDDNGWTALMYGAYYNHLETVKALVDAGAILVIPEEKVSSEAKLTKELSSLTGNPEIIQLLKMAVKLDTEVGKEADFGADKDQQFLSSSSRSTDDKGSWLQRFFPPKWRKSTDSTNLTLVKPLMNKKKTRTIEASELLEISLPSNKSDSLRSRSGHRRSHSNDMDTKRISTVLDGMESKKLMLESSMDKLGGSGLLDPSMAAVAHDGHRRSASFTNRKDMLNASHHSLANSLSTVSINDTVLTALSDAKDLKTFLHILDLEQYVPMFESSGIVTVQELINLAESDLQDMGIGSPGHRRLLILTGQSWKSEQQKQQLKKVHEVVGNLISPDVPDGRLRKPSVSTPGTKSRPVKPDIGGRSMTLDRASSNLGQQRYDSDEDISNTHIMAGELPPSSSSTFTRSQTSSSTLNSKPRPVSVRASPSNEPGPPILTDKMDMIKQFKASKRSKQNI